MITVDEAYDIATKMGNVDTEKLFNIINKDLHTASETEVISHKVENFLRDINQSIVDATIIGKLATEIPEMKYDYEERIKVVSMLYINGYILSFNKDTIYISWKDPKSDKRFDPKKFWNTMQK